MSFENIERSAFHRGYVGYGGNRVYIIKKSTSSHGTWHAQNQLDANDQIWAFGLAAMSRKLKELEFVPGGVKPRVFRFN